MILKLKHRGRPEVVPIGFPSDVQCPYCHNNMEVNSAFDSQQYWCEVCWAVYTTKIKSTITIQTIQTMIKDLRTLNRTARVIIDEDNKYEIQMYVRSQVSRSGYSWMNLATKFKSNEINKAAELVACMRLWR